MKFRTTHPIAREAWPFALPCIVLAAACGAGVWLQHWGWAIPAALCAIAAAYVLWFFRHPHRALPPDEAAFICPADGRIVSTGSVPHPDFPDGQALRVAIFMSLFNVHINWAPCRAVVEKVEYFRGRFLNAMDDKSSEENERKVLYLRTPSGDRVIVKLVAGLIARRIVSPIAAGDSLERGETIGLIRFGSRVELLVPAHYELCVGPGDKVCGRQTILVRPRQAAGGNLAGGVAQ
jgi:phosphatidylserine decarboxylase